jgi:zinc protease
MIRAGAAQDPPEKPGVAALAAALLDQGTTTRSAEQIQLAIDTVGGIIGAGSSTEMTSVHAVVLKDSFTFALDLLFDIARNAAFDAQEVEFQRKQMLSGLTVSYEDPDYLAGVIFERLVYGFHPYGRPNSGTPESLAAIARQDLVEFHKSWFGANNAILAIVGDITTEEAFAGAERVFGTWGKAARTAEKPVDPPAPTRRLIVVDRPGAVQTEIRAGNIALPRRHPDYLALDLAMKILGGEGGNRLHRVLRSDRGLTYGASADLHARRDAGHIVADTDTRSESTAEALRLLVDEMWRLRRQRVSERELADAQAYLTGSFPLTIETPRAIAQQILHAVFHGIDLEELQTYRERVNAVSVDDIQRVAAAHLHPDRLSIVLVGDASRFVKQLPGAGFAEFERIPIAELDLNSPDLRRRGSRNGARGPAAPERLVTGAPAFRSTPAAGHGPEPDLQRADEAKTLIERAVRAKGGLEKLRSIRTIRAVSETRFQTPDGPLAVPTLIRVMYPGSFRIDLDMPKGPVVQVFHRGTFWVRDARGVSTAPGAAAESMRGNIQRDSIALLVALAEGRVSARRAEDVTLEGRRMPALTIDLQPAGPLTLVLDAASGLILREMYAAPGSEGQIEESYADYRDVQGLQVAFAVTVRHPDLPPVTRVIREFEYNVPLEPSLFARPG